jgi:hypothetical protein
MALLNPNIAWGRTDEFSILLFPSIELAPLKQPTTQVCWATAYTIMLSEKDQASYTIREAEDGKRVRGMAGERLHIWETDTGRLRGILLPGQGRISIAITADGHYACNEDVKRHLLKVVRKAGGAQELLSPDEFERKYGWKNNQEKFHLANPRPAGP